DLRGPWALPHLHDGEVLRLAVSRDDRERGVRRRGPAGGQLRGRAEGRRVHAEARVRAGQDARLARADEVRDGERAIPQSICRGLRREVKVNRTYKSHGTYKSYSSVGTPQNSRRAFLSAVEFPGHFPRPLRPPVAN